MELFGFRIKLKWNIVLFFILGGILVLTSGLIETYISVINRYLPLFSLPEQVTSTTAISFALIALLITLLSVLLHEFGHAYATRHLGYEFDHIEISGMGGAALTETIPIVESKDRIVQVLLGPVVTLLLGLCGIILYVLNPINSPLLSLVFSYIAVFNLGTFAMNILPIYPFDGGRLFFDTLNSRMNNSLSSKLTIYAGYLTQVAIVGLVFYYVNGFVAGVVGAYFILLINSREQLSYDLGNAAGEQKTPVEIFRTHLSNSDSFYIEHPDTIPQDQQKQVEDQILESNGNIVAYPSIPADCYIVPKEHMKYHKEMKRNYNASVIPYEDVVRKSE